MTNHEGDEFSYAAGQLQVGAVLLGEMAVGGETDGDDNLERVQQHVAAAIDSLGVLAHTPLNPANITNVLRVGLEINNRAAEVGVLEPGKLSLRGLNRRLQEQAGRLSVDKVDSELAEAIAMLDGTEAELPPAAALPTFEQLEIRLQDKALRIEAILQAIIDETAQNPGWVFNLAKLDRSLQFTVKQQELGAILAEFRALGLLRLVTRPSKETGRFFRLDEALASKVSIDTVTIAVTMTMEEKRLADLAAKKQQAADSEEPAPKKRGRPPKAEEAGLVEPVLPVAFTGKSDYIIEHANRALDGQIFNTDILKVSGFSELFATVLHQRNARGENEYQAPKSLLFLLGKVVQFKDQPALQKAVIDKIEELQRSELARQQATLDIEHETQPTDTDI